MSNLEDFKVWEILTEDEKTSITLSLSFSKSTWEVGEIMEKSHYKQLEILQRANKFMEVFTNYFEKYGDNLVPEEIDISISFKEYLQLTILERLKVTKAVKKMQHEGYKVPDFRNRDIIKNMKILSDSKKEIYNDLFRLIMDFDRWNNFRILPTDLQEPSAYKRRNKARYRKHLDNLCNIPTISINGIIKGFSYSGKYKKVYVPLFNRHFDGDFYIMSIRDLPEKVREISDMGLFIFINEELANSFGKLVTKYIFNKNLNCKVGLDFWPKFREFLAKAYNYADLENIHVTRRSLDKAINKYNGSIIRRKKNPNKVKRSKESEFWL